MMQIMHLRSPAQQAKRPIPAVRQRRLQHAARQKRPKGQDVYAQQRRRDRHGEDIQRDMLDRMRVLGCERNRRGEPVVVFVDVAVEEWPVQRAVDVVEEDLSSQGAEDGLWMIGTRLGRGEALRCGICV